VVLSAALAPFAPLPFIRKLEARRKLVPGRDMRLVLKSPASSRSAA
jgi:hypothetical protein